MYHCTTKFEGFKIITFFTAITVILNLIVSYMLNISYQGGYSGYEPAFNTTYILVQSGIAIPVALISLYAVGWFSALLSRSIGHGRNDPDKTIGFLGYVQIVSLVIGIIQVIAVSIIFIAIPEPNTEGMMEDIFFNSSRAMAFVMISIILAIISFIWGLWVAGNAVSVANNVNLGEGIVSYFFAILIIGFIIVGIIVTALIALFVAIAPGILITMFA